MSHVGEANHCGIVWNKLQENVFCEQPREFDMQKTFPLNIVLLHDYKSVNDLEKHSDFCTAAV